MINPWDHEIETKRASLRTLEFLEDAITAPPEVFQLLKEACLDGFTRLRHYIYQDMEADEGEKREMITFIENKKQAFLLLLSIIPELRKTAWTMTDEQLQRAERNLRLIEEKVKRKGL